MTTAIITGASSGIGKEFVRQLKTYGTFDEVWVIARSKNNLEELKTGTDLNIVPVPMDLSSEASYEEFENILKEKNPDVRLLINCSGFGKFDATDDYPLSESLNMIDLNCKGVTALSVLTLKYMGKGSKIVNIASVAAFQPIPYINVYAATKAYVLYFSRALNRELKPRGITVTAVCPFLTKTIFFNRASTKKEPIVKKYVAMYNPEDIVKRAYRDVKKGKDVSKYGFIARLQAFLCKIMPHSFVMSVWMNQQKLNKKQKEESAKK